MNQYRKTIVALFGVGVLVAQTELGAGSKWVTYLIALGVALGVYSVRNEPT